MRKAVRSLLVQIFFRRDLLATWTENAILWLVFDHLHIADNI